VESGKQAIQYEKTDAEPGPVAGLGVALAVVTILVSLALIPLVGLLKRASEAGDPPPPHLVPEAGRLPPGPRLQPQPFADWRKLQAEEKQLLESYGWVDEAAGVVRIPVSEAMRIVAQRGLPARAEVVAVVGASPSPAPASPASGAAASPTPAPGAHR